MTQATRHKIADAVRVVEQALRAEVRKFEDLKIALMLASLSRRMPTVPLPRTAALPGRG